MSDELSNLIWVGVSLLIGAALIAMLFAFNNMGHDLMSNVYQEEADAAALQQARQFMPYEGTELSGAEVLSAALELADRGYYVYFNTSTTGGYYAVVPTGKTATDANAMLKRAKTNYVNNNPDPGLSLVRQDTYAVNTLTAGNIFVTFDSKVAANTTFAQHTFKSKVYYDQANPNNPILVVASFKN